ncbi:MAG: YidC/Oxa1 family rane protein insertase [Thermoanaerobacter sp.]|jgi:YidC/Oxa1 family membrane protein insertase|nr:YidC/Oxa1 family rane protein insertase [Thermoanaerobacter sp.]
MTTIAVYLGQLLEFIHHYVGNYGIAIIIFTILIRILLLPFYIQQMNTMKKMKEIQPLVQELQKKYVKDPQKLNMETMKLYQEKKVNPFGGCLPMLLPLIILWPLFTMLRTYPAFSTASFLWIHSLAQKDPYYIIPILAAVTTYISSAMVATDKSQNSMNIMMSIFMGWITVSLPAGVGIYWVTSNIFQIVQQYIFMRETNTAKGES